MDNKTSGKMMKRKNPYMILDVTPFRDTRLTWKAKGLMTYFLDKPEDWVFYLEHIYTQAPDGEKAVRSGIKELQKYGYVVRIAYRKNKKVDHYGFLVYEEPVAYPSEKPIHVDIDEWDHHLKGGGDIDITLFAQNRKAGQTLDKSLFAQNQQAGNEQGGNQQAGNAGLLNTNGTNHLSLPNTKDDDDKAILPAWEKDSAYNEYRNRIMDGNGEDIAVHSRHYPVFRQLADEIGVSELFSMLDKYIVAVINGEHSHKTPQAVWFLKGGWKNYDHREPVKPKRKPNGSPSPSGSGSQNHLRRAVAEAIKREANGETISDGEVDPEIEARLRAKLNRMRERLGQRQKEEITS